MYERKGYTYTNYRAVIDTLFHDPTYQYNIDSSQWWPFSCKLFLTSGLKIGRHVNSCHFQPVFQLAEMSFVVDTAMLSIDVLPGQSMFRRSTITTIDNDNN